MEDNLFEEEYSMLNPIDLIYLNYKPKKNSDLHV